MTRLYSNVVSTGEGAPQVCCKSLIKSHIACIAIRILDDTLMRSLPAKSRYHSRCIMPSITELLTLDRIEVDAHVHSKKRLFEHISELIANDVSHLSSADIFLFY